MVASLVRFFLHCPHDLQESADVLGRDAAGDRFLEIGEVALHAPRDLRAGCGRGDHERSAIARPDLAGDQTAGGEPIQNARERRAFVGEAPVQLGNRRWRRGREQRQDVRLALRQRVLTQTRQVQADAVRRSMNGRNQA